MITIISGARVVDVLTGDCDDRDVVVQGGSIVDVVPPGSGPEGERLDLRGHYLLPGLSNAHVHFGLILPGPDASVLQGETVIDTAFRSYGNASRALAAGVTSVRWCGERQGVDGAVRRAIASGHISGPRVFTAGRALCTTGGHAHSSWMGLECSGAEDFRRRAREQLRDGADFIKIMLTGGLASAGAVTSAQMTPAELAAVTEVAAAAGKRVAAHVGSPQAIADALRAGVSSIEHAYTLTDEVAGQMAEAGAFLVPTLIVGQAAEWMRARGAPEWMVAKTIAAGEEHGHAFSRAIRAGVRIVCGTDMMPAEPIDGTVATVRELELLHAAGLPALQVIQAATVTFAELCGATQLGRIRPGAAADFVATPHNPLDDISGLRHIDFVMKAGTTIRYSDRVVIGR